MKLRDYQEKMVRDIQTTSSNVIAALPTGGGKSHIIQQLVARDPSNKYAVVVRNEPLIAQLIDRLKEVGLTVGIIKAGYKFDNTKEYDVYLIMEQTFHTRKMVLPSSLIDVVIKDEFHTGFNTKQFNHIQDVLKPKRVIGLTATPITEGGIGIHNVLSDYKLIEGVTTQSLIDEGYLSKITYSLPTNSKLSSMLTEELAKVKITAGEYASGELEAILNTPEHNKLVVSEVIGKCLTKGRKTLIFASNIAHVEALANDFTEEGIDVVYMHSKMSKADRVTAMELYMTGEVNVMINMSILTIGFDDPATDAIVLLRPTKVLRLYLQIVGRGIRALPGKEDCLVLDLANSLKEHGFAETERSFNIKDKEAYDKQKEDCSVDELPDVVDADGKVTSGKVIEYRIEQKQQRIDKLIEENQLLQLRLQENNSTEAEVSRLAEQLRITRVNAKSVQTRLTTLTTTSKKMKTELTYLKKHIPNAEEVISEDARLDELFEIVSSDRSLSFMPKYLAAIEGYSIVGNTIPTDDEIYKLGELIRHAECFYMEKSLVTKLRKNIDNEESIDLLNFAEWVEGEYLKNTG